ncbi:hypothetical protein MRB53_036878 [Persea americana]|nr:hypothetical protein MRB53_036878 [Persea americana]
MFDLARVVCICEARGRRTEDVKMIERSSVHALRRGLDRKVRMYGGKTTCRIIALASNDRCRNAWGHISYDEHELIHASYVGNKTATFVLQALGNDVSAINTVNFSNHTGYRQRTGRVTPAEEIQTLYDGLKQSELNAFDVLLSGYCASKEAVATVGNIAREIKLKANMRPGVFFWGVSSEVLFNTLL